MNVVDDKAIVKEYFNNTGFDRWKRIYGDGEVNKIQLDVRIGHQRTVDTLLEWFETDNNLEGLSICDAGCGVGSLSIPLATAKAIVTASDISEKMVGEAKVLAAAQFGNNDNPSFSVQDLESISGSYHTVVCLDVLIHYPQEKAAEMIAHLASTAQSRLIISFAPKTPCLSLLKKIGGFFPGASKATRSYLHREADVVEILEAQGFTINRKAMTKKRVYFSRMIEAVRTLES
jgi:magnesium-protoporphyrin O-methyltransferase